MSTGYDERAALNQGLWEQLDAMTDSAARRIDRLLLGDEVYDYSQEVAADVRRLEHEHQLELYRLAVRIGKRNRGETE